MNRFMAIRLDEKEYSNKYIAVMTFKQLTELTEIKSLSNNREVNPDRASEMMEFIKDEKAFYPPLILSTNKKILNYKNNEIHIRYDKKNSAEEKPFSIIDGQHRFQSIEKLCESIGDDKSQIFNRLQSIFIIENISDVEQRKIFIDINENAKKVTLATKERFKITLANYMGLKIIKDNDILKGNINMDIEKTEKIDKYPYKYVIAANKILLFDLEKRYLRNEFKLNDLEEVADLLNEFWSNIYTFIKYNYEKCDYLITLEFIKLISKKVVEELSEGINRLISKEIEYSGVYNTLINNLNYLFKIIKDDKTIEIINKESLVKNQTKFLNVEFALMREKNEEI